MRTRVSHFPLCSSTGTRQPERKSNLLRYNVLRKFFRCGVERYSEGERRHCPLERKRKLNRPNSPICRITIPCSEASELRPKRWHRGLVLRAAPAAAAIRRAIRQVPLGTPPHRWHSPQPTSFENWMQPLVHTESTRLPGIIPFMSRLTIGESISP